MAPRSKPLRIFMVAGEHSGDQLAGKLIPALRRQAEREIELSGVGGEAMEDQGCTSLFPLSEIAVMGPLAIASRLPRIVRRVYQTVSAAVAARPDVLVIVDSPEFTHAVAKRFRRRRPEVPVLNYVSPSIWAWRSGRARKMRRYIDHVLALLPFEPAAHERFGGPACSYVGHPLSERYDWIGSLDPAPLAAELGLRPDVPVLVVLPGSRASEVGRLMTPFGETVRALANTHAPMEVIIPTVASVRSIIESACADWPIQPHITEGETRKFQAFRLARAALAASGTVTLELAMSGVPMVVAYKVDALAWSLRGLLKVSTVVLPNLVIGRNAIPEFLQDTCTGQNLSGAIEPLLQDSDARRAQIEALAEVQARMQPAGETPSERAARIILSYT